MRSRACTGEQWRVSSLSLTSCDFDQNTDPFWVLVEHLPIYHTELMQRKTDHVYTNISYHYCQPITLNIIQ